MDLFQRSIILILALAGHTGKQGGGLRYGAWWNMAMNYDKRQLALLALEFRYHVPSGEETQL